jgi:putative DNA primase/helicase
LTDLGNARRLVKRFGDRLRYCRVWGAWLVWDGRRWREDANGKVYHLAKRTVRAIGAEAAVTADEDEAKRLRRWALDSESRRRIDAMIGLAWSEPGVPVEPIDLNQNPWLLCVQNGVVDLRTGTLRPHNPADLITKVANTIFDPAAVCPRWLQFEREIFAGDEDLIGYMRRKLGYALTGLDSVQELDVLHGDGANGKSVFLDTLLGMLGEYGCQAAPDLLMAKDGSNDHPTSLADLDGRRFVAASETEAGRRLAESLVKRLTGDKIIKARKMRCDFYSFPRTFKLFLACNHKPRIRGSDLGIWRRIRMIPFRVTFVKPGKELAPPLVLPEVEGLTEELAGEYPGILNLLVQGCLAWQAGGMRHPESVEAATASYKAEMDVVGDFIADRCEVDTGLSVKAKELYDAYKNWCEESGIRAVLPLREFGQDMERRGYAVRHTKTGNIRDGMELSREHLEFPPEGG